MEFTLQRERAIGYNLSRILQEKKMTSEQLAEKVSCNPMHIKAILTGSIGVKEQEIADIAETLEVSSSDICTAHEDEMKDYNIHYMGTVNDSLELNKILDDVDMYVRLLNMKSCS
ncbi:MAG: helix-turn-helix domain-containing protein [Lachnospiraceae bacterium]